jgi:hypothetical protein
MLALLGAEGREARDKEVEQSNRELSARLSCLAAAMGNGVKAQRAWQPIERQLIAKELRRLKSEEDARREMNRLAGALAALSRLGVPVWPEDLDTRIRELFGRIEGLSATERTELSDWLRRTYGGDSRAIVFALERFSPNVPTRVKRVLAGPPRRPMDPGLYSRRLKELGIPSKPRGRRPRT